MTAQFRFGRPADGQRMPAASLWVLVGALGSVNAILRFLRNVPEDLPVAFVVAVRTSPQGLALLGDLIARTTPVVTHLAGLERTLYPRDVLLVPLDGVDDAAVARRAGTGAAPQPLDEVLGTIAAAYRDRAGVIFFSGIGPEGAVGCHAILRHGGRIWTQDDASSEYAGLPAFIAGVCEVDASGTPEALGERIAALVR